MISNFADTKLETTMIRMQIKQEIILRYYRQGHSQRKISRDMDICRKTVRRYIESYQKAKSKSGEEGLSSTILEAPKYDSSNRQKRKLTRAIREKIDGYLEQNRIKRQQGKRKQQLKKIDILEALQAQGHKIGYTTVCNYIRDKEQQSETFIRQQYKAGEQGEFDWGEVKLMIEGKQRTFQIAVFYLNWSNYRYAHLYERQDTQSYQESHVNFFEHIGGVPGEMVYDNMRVAISRFVGKYEKQATKGLLSLSMYYQFGFRFCNVRKGNEKGGVERSVEFVRRKAFALQDEFADLASANAHLHKILKGLNEQYNKIKGNCAKGLLLKARPFMEHCPAIGMECADLRSCRVDKYATIIIDSNRYSVPEAFTGRMMEVKIYAQRLQFYYEGKAVWGCVRHRSKHQWYLHLDHYLESFRRKPGALNRSAALRNAEAIVQKIHDRYFRKQPKDFIDLLHYQRQEGYTWTAIQQAIDHIHQVGCRQISLDKIKQCLASLKQQDTDKQAGNQINSPSQAADTNTSQSPNQMEHPIVQMSQQQLRQLAHLFNQNN